MDVLLAHGYFLAEDEHERRVMKPYPTLGLLYISSYLKAQGHAVGVFDATFQTLADFEARLRVERPRAVGLYTNLMTKFNVLKMMAASHAAGAKVILGGPEPAMYAEEYLARDADVIVVGEGEHTMAELLSKGFEELPSIAGIIFRQPDGTVVRNPPRPYVKDLDALPFPDREAIDMDRYVAVWRENHGMGSVSLICARGCPFHCQWCSHAVYGNSHRRRSPANVLAELEMLLERYRPDQIWYADDVFTIHRKWFFQYAELLIQRGIKVPFECISRSDCLNEEVVQKLAQIGCYRLWLGSESGSQRVLDAMRRDVKVEDVQAKAKLLQRHGIQVGMFIMLGYEGETLPDIEATTRHLKVSNPDVFLTTVAYPIKGTGYYKTVERRVLARVRWDGSTDRDLSVEGRYSPRFYSFATRWMVNAVELHREWRGPRRPVPLAKTLANTLIGRAGMLVTQHERERSTGSRP
ncbi:MAG TPA: radical SAM protein [Polyangiaceae bacterium]|jgi:anaerobic magnesium-protoporphyrin IX monomethyl ester cyclase|nr:radical SAM protein [Polyangiaceae bacterium]